MSFLNNQNSKEQLRLVISSIRVGVVSKADDDVLHVLSTIKTYSYFSFVFSFVPKKVDLLEIAKVMWLRWKSIRPCKMVEKKRINFSVSSDCTLLCSWKENVKFPAEGLAAVHCNCPISCIITVSEGRPENTTNTTVDIYLSETTIKTLKQNVKFVQTCFKKVKF